MRTLTQETHAIVVQDDVVAARRLAREIARELGFDAFAAAAITTATSELARNILVHGGGGRVVLRRIVRGTQYGIQIDFYDEGPGIGELDRALRGGFSTRRSLGLGLSGSKRLVDEFRIESKPGEGTHIEVRKWGRV